MSTRPEETNRFRVNVRDRVFYLTKSQIEFDSPNFFTTAFLGGFAEAQTKSVDLACDPMLFDLVVDYLSGYDILPLTKDAIPARMNVGQAMRAIRKDADYLSLSGLETLLARNMETLVQQKPHIPMQLGEFLDIGKVVWMSDIILRFKPLSPGLAVSLKLLPQQQHDTCQQLSTTSLTLDYSTFYPNALSSQKRLSVTESGTTWIGSVVDIMNGIGPSATCQLPFETQGDVPLAFFVTSAVLVFTEKSRTARPSEPPYRFTGILRAECYTTKHMNAMTDSWIFE